MPEKQESVGIIGMGFVGVTLGTALAEAGYQVIGYDVRSDLPAGINAGRCPFHEEGLADALCRVVDAGRLRCTNDGADCQADIYVICVGTPTDARNRPVIEPLKRACGHVAGLLRAGDLVIMRSTVPPGTTRAVALPILEAGSGLRGGLDFDLAFAPERTVEGKALRELRELPQVIGGLNERATERAAAVFSRSTPKIVRVASLETAEIVKTIDNTYRDCRFAYANELSGVCEACGVDAMEAISAANQDYPRNDVPLPSPGVGGPCLTKDPYLLMNAAREGGYEADLLAASRRINSEGPVRVAERLHRWLLALGKDPADSRIFLMGFAFKGVPETSDLRGSCTVTLAKKLLELGYAMRGHDPVAPWPDMARCGAEPCDIEQGFLEADAAVIMNNHPSYRRLPVRRLAGTMRAPAVFFDGWRLYDPQTLQLPTGVYYLGTGYERPIPSRATTAAPREASRA